jgi:Domain of unknown function (DUF4169)
MNVVNLNKARKAKDRMKDRNAADANAAKFGRSKAEKTRDAAEAEKARRDLDGHRKE